MKILLVSTSSGSRGGGELGLLYLGRALAARGHEVALWVSDHPKMDELAASFAPFGQVLRAPYVNTYDRRGRSLASALDRRTPARVAAQWSAFKPDVIHLNKQNLEDGLDLVEAATQSGLPCVAMIHITQSARYLRAAFAGLRDAVSRRELRRFPGRFVTTPESRCRDLSEFLGSESPAVCNIFNGVPIPEQSTQQLRRNETRDELGYGAEDLVCIAVGRLVPQKRPLLFLELAARISKRLPHARFLWIGDGALAEEWDRAVAAQSLGRIVRRLPWRHDVPALLAAADVFLHVAEFEGLAFAILEALASGLPCAITPNLLGEMPFLNASNSLVIDDDSWLEALADRARLQALGRAARQLAEERFSFDRMAADYEALYRETIAATR